MRRAIPLALCLLGALVPLAAAAGPTRAKYVTELERICKPGSDATERAVQGVRADVRAERLSLAGSKFARAKSIFGGTVRSIATVPRPEADRATLSRWFEALAREEFYLGQMVRTLKTSNVPGFQRVSARFIHEGNRANNAVVSFGFNYCSFKPTRFQ